MEIDTELNTYSTFTLEHIERHLIIKQVLSLYE